MTKPNLLFILLVATALSGCGQEQEQQDKQEMHQLEQQQPAPQQPAIYPEIKAYAARIEQYADDTSATKYDSLESVNAQLMAYLKSKGNEVSVLEEPMKGADSTGILRILTSADNKFRIYCWNTLTGGTMNFFNAIAQYATPGGSNTYVLNDISGTSEEDARDPGCLYRSLATIKTRSNKTFYIAFYTGIYSSRDISEGIKAFTIEGDKLIENAKIFQTGKGLVDGISYSYDFFESGIEDQQGNRYSIHLNKEQTKLYVPLINNKDKFTGKYLIYVFNGEQFVYDKNAKD